MTQKSKRIITQNHQQIYKIYFLEIVYISNVKTLGDRSNTKIRK